MLTYIRLRHPLADDVLSSHTAYKEMKMPKLGACSVYSLYSY